MNFILAFNKLFFVSITECCCFSRKKKETFSWSLTITFHNK